MKHTTTKANKQHTHCINTETKTQHITVTQDAPNNNKQTMLKHPKQIKHDKHTLTSTTTIQHNQTQINQPSTRQTHQSKKQPNPKHDQNKRIKHTQNTCKQTQDKLH